MATTKTMSIAFPRGGLLPAALMKKKTDVAVPPHEPVDVPFEYGKQLVDDKFAYDASELAAANAKLADAQAAVDAATAKLAAADDASKAAAEAELTAAQEALAILKA